MAKEEPKKDQPEGDNEKPTSEQTPKTPPPEHVIKAGQSGGEKRSPENKGEP